MAISSANYTITTTPSQVFLGNGATNVYLHSSSGTCFLGASDLVAQGWTYDGKKLVAPVVEAPSA
jgi:hypothetical protein